MKLVNYTPWPHLLFERGDREGGRELVLTLQGTYTLGTTLEAMPVQPPVAAADEFRGDPQTTGLRRAGAIASTKPKSDIAVNAIARSSEPAKSWEVSLSVGELVSKLSVRGPHEWRIGDAGWTLSEPEPCCEVPLIYEHAFGGGHIIDGARIEEPRNPIGCGFLPSGIEARAFPAPQVVAVDEPTHEPGERYVPRGWAPIPSYFAPRRECIGTADDRWLKTRWPRPPEDFDDAFYQSAHPDLIYPGYLRGDEAIRIDGVTVSGEPIVTALPGWCVFVLLRVHPGRLVVWPARLDQLHLEVADPDPAKHLAHLTWRAVFPKSASIWEAQARFVPMNVARREEAA